MLSTENPTRNTWNLTDIEDLETANEFQIRESKHLLRNVFPSHRGLISSTDQKDLISIVIPTRGDSGIIRGEERVFVVEAVDSIVQKSTWQNFEIVIVADDATPQPVINELERLAGSKLQFVRWTEPFNFSKKMNRGIACSNGKFIIALNDDVEIVTPDWLEQQQLVMKDFDASLVGSLLFFEDASIQHAGHYYQGGAGHIGINENWNPYISTDCYAVNRYASGATAACAMFSRKTFDLVGGFSNRFPNNFNDVDLSLKITICGKKSAIAGGSRLYHFESKTRVPTVLHSEAIELRRRWAKLITEDPYWKEAK